jgi:hypothetical protein
VATNFLTYGAFVLAQVKVFGGRGNLRPKLWQIFCELAATCPGLGSEKFS